MAISRAHAQSVQDVSDIVNDARASGAAMVIARSPAEDLAVAQAIEAAGGRLCDTLVYFSRTLDSPVAEPPRGVRPARGDDVDRITAIAEAAFTGYGGHYHADPRLDRAAADAGYVDWAARSARTDHALVVEDAGVVVGFLTMRIGEGETEIVLNAIAPERQGRGHYRALVAAALQDSIGLGARRCTVSTQVSNVAAQKVWVRLGFEPMRAVHTFHIWLDQTLPQPGMSNAPSASS